MQRAKSTTPIQQLQSWQQLKCGECYHHALKRYFTPWADKRQAQTHLFLGNLSGEIIALDKQNINLQLSPNPESFMPSHARLLVKADLCQLPLIETCVDNCWLINTLNFSHDPHQILREVNRVLCDDGYLFIALFNPWSSLLCKRHFHDRLHRNRTLPFRQFILWRVIDWLDLLGFEIIQHTTLARPSWFSGHHLRAIVARKTVLSPTLNTEKVRFHRPVLHPASALTSQQNNVPHSSQ
ncbi:methyltransferase domain-containing protein [Spirabiliibacterium falconis]|uniref:methyltransferase domain-containing protein n=1 Tax=Spirabiliibacterium falconis TaxID=572023 RepID=UPI001AAD1B93|nr:methyltransferase domain-containing protein [Spirabiliibacterium falconis]MBE2893650.1 methyltransferase domain-containing protein [Spirabiliibacterium falconis]